MRERILDDNFYLNFIKMNPLVHSESDIYHNFSLAYKIYVDSGNSHSNFLKDMERKRKKIELLSQVKGLDNAILPIDLLFSMKEENKIFTGYSMEYVDRSKTLFEAYFKMSTSDFLKLLSNISISLRNIHRRSEGIVIGDLSFFNILVKIVDNVYRYYFIDFDNASIDNLSSERISQIAGDYLVFRNTSFKINENFDKLTFLLHFFDLIFGKEIYKISMYEYDREAEKMAVLKRLRDIVFEIRKPNGRLPDVPYFHEVAYIPVKSLVKH